MAREPVRVVRSRSCKSQAKEGCLCLRLRGSPSRIPPRKSTSSCSKRSGRIRGDSAPVGT